MTPLVHRGAVWMLLLGIVSGAPVARDEQDVVDQLVRQFAPLLFLHPEERWLPDDADRFLESVTVLTGDGRIINGSLPLGPQTADHYLIAPLPTGVGTPEVQHEPFLGGSGPEGAPVYVTVTHCDPLDSNRLQQGGGEQPSFLATYWTFHPFNEGKWAYGQMRGNHVGDWEHVSIRIKHGQLVEVFVSAHEFGAYYTYSPESGRLEFTSQMSRGVIFSPQYPPHLELEDTHPVLYVALGSHGLWPTVGRHQYNRVPSLVDVTAQGTAWRTWRRLQTLSRSPPHWLRFAGRWGNPANCGHLVPAFCELGRGPPGLARRPADLQCGGRPVRRSWWRRLFSSTRRFFVGQTEDNTPASPEAGLTRGRHDARPTVDGDNRHRTSAAQGE